MKLTKKYLIKLIKEELENEPPSPELIKFVRGLLNRPDMTPNDIYNAVQGSYDASSVQVKQAIEKAKEAEEAELEKLASSYLDLYNSIHNSWYRPKIKDTDTIEDIGSKIKELMDKQKAERFEKLVRYAKENPPSSDDPEEMFGTVSFDDGIEPRGDE